MCLALCLPSNSAMLMLAGSEIFLRRGEGNTRLSIPGIFDIVLFLAGVWSISHGRIFKETEKYNEIFLTKVETRFLQCLHTDFLSEMSPAGGLDPFLVEN